MTADLGVEIFIAFFVLGVILFIAATLGLSAVQLRQATPHEAVLILVQAGCVLTIIAILEGVGRGRPGRS